MLTKYTLLAAASLACAALTIGCQNSGHSTAEADYSERPATATPAGYTAAPDLTMYNTPYTLKRDSSYMMSPTSTVTAGTLRSGDTVYLRSGTLDTQTSNGWVAAKTADGRLVYLRADDLQMK